MASNNFVVHGDHTETGLPLYESDPHLKNTLPCTWLMANLHDTKSGRNISGIMLPGTTLIAMGRTDDISFSGTVSRVDTSDLWQEKLNEDETEYFVDNTWRKLEVRTEVIKVKGQEDVILEVKHTHRGPVIPFESLRFNSELLFSSLVPEMPFPGMYSFAWSG